MLASAAVSTRQRRYATGATAGLASQRVAGAPLFMQTGPAPTLPKPPNMCADLLNICASLHPAACYAAHRLTFRPTCVQMGMPRSHISVVKL